MSLLADRICRLQEVITCHGLNSAPIIVLGMHRSGTTMISKLLGKSGVFMGARLSGNHEPRVFQDANRQIFDYFQAGWMAADRLPSSSSLMNGFDGLAADIALRLIEEIPSSFCDTLQDKPIRWGFKDPRSSVTAGLFLRLFPDAKAIFIHRNCEDVAASILKRELKIRSKYPDGADAAMEPSEVILIRAIKAWEVYNERSLTILPYFRGYETLRYEDVVVSPQVHLKKAFAGVGVEIAAETIASACISSERVGGSAEFANSLEKLRGYLSRSPVREMLDRQSLRY